MSTWRPLPDADGPSPRPVRESLDRVARSLGGADATALAAVFRRWHEAVGEPVASHAWPVSLVRGRLIVGVDQPIWYTQLSYLQGELLRRLDEVVGAGVVRQLDLRVRARREPVW